MRSVALSAAFLVLIAFLATPAAAAATGSVAQTTSPENVSALAGGELSAPSTTMNVYLQPDRSANWEVSVEYELTTASQRAAFDTFEDEYETGSAAVGPDAELYRNIATRVSEQTGRDMAISNVDYTASRQGEVGQLTLSFTWTEFLRSVTDGETQRFVFNDVLRTADGESWLTTLRANQTLRIHTPSGYAITTANRGVSRNTVEINGPQTFDAEEHIRVVYEESVFGAGAVRFLGVAVIIASLIIGGAVLLSRTDRVHVRDTVLPSSSDGDDEPTTTEGPEPDGQQHGVDEQAASSGDQSPEPTEEPAAATQEPAIDPTLVADDERIERLLERNGGRMRQADIVDETNWSDAKVSQLLSSMADEDQITKLRIGRENLITLPDVDPVDDDAAESDESTESDDDADSGEA